MKFGYLGPKGTYSEQVANLFVKKLNLKSIKLIPIKSIGSIFKYLDKKEINLAVFPLKNSETGDINEVIDGLKKRNLINVSSIRMKIIFALGMHPQGKKDKIFEIRSKDIALVACSKYLDLNFKKTRRVEVSSTVLPMEEIINHNLIQVGVIGSNEALKKNGLKILNSNIGNQKNNYTSFVLLKLNLKPF